jgi:chromosome segregation ATPase
MASDKSADPPSEGEEEAAALAGEVKALRGLLEDLQAELRPAVQSSLRERSTELQRLGGELAERQAEALRLRQALDAAEARSAGLERDVDRWRDAARRGLDEIAERARAAAARFEAETATLNQALTAAKAELKASRAEATAAAEALHSASALAERRQRRVRALRAKVLGRERRRMQMTRSLSWRITAPLRWLPAALHRLMRRGARLRRKLFRR